MNGPGYWMYESTGRLRPVIEAYLRDEPLDETQITIMRLYLRQWIMADSWDMNPHIEEEHRAWLTAMRLAVGLLKSREAIALWLDKAEESGMNPL